MSKWDIIRTSAPVDRKAALSMAKGEQAPTLVKKQNFASMTCPPLCAVPRDPSFKNLVGLECNGSRVVGLADKKRLGIKGEGARWVMRCVCGIYEIRTSKAIKSGVSRQFKCSSCDNVAEMRRGWAPQGGGILIDERLGDE